MTTYNDKLVKVDIFWYYYATITITQSRGSNNEEEIYSQFGFPFGRIIALNELGDIYKACILIKINCDFKAKYKTFWEKFLFTKKIDTKCKTTINWRTGKCVLTSSFTKYRFLQVIYSFSTIVNWLSVLKLF